jgi:hypothetical protein
MGYKVQAKADLGGTSKIHTGWKIKITKDARSSWSWKEGDDVIQLIDSENEILIVVKKDNFDKLIKRGVIQVV